MNTQSFEEIKEDLNYNKGFEAGEKSLQNGTLVLIDGFLYKTTRSILNKAKLIMDSESDAANGIEYLQANSKLIRNKSIDSYNS